MTVAPQESKEDKFKRLATKRVEAALKKVSLIGNLAGPGYRYTDEQVQTILNGLREAVNDVEGKFQKGASRSKSTFSL